MIERACKQGRGDGFTIPGVEPSYAPDLALEPVHCAVELRLEIEAARAAGRVTTTVRCNRPGARTLRLNAVDFDDLSVSGPDQWRYDGKAIELTWAEPFAAGEERDVEVRYRVEQPISGMQFSAADEAYPHRPLFVVTDHETERARYWLPCVDYPTVRTTFDFRLTAPAELTILASGTREAETENGDGTKTAHWKLDYPCPSYLCCFAAGRLSRFSDESVDGRPIEYYGAEHTDPQDLQRAFGKTPGMMRWLADRLGVPFPFPKYFQLALPDIGGAMENISLVTWDEWLVLDKDLAPEWGPRVDSINIHEMAHSYFGDAVVCRHFEHSWLKESWATYIETVWRQENLGEDEARFNLHVDAASYMGEADSRYVRPIVTRHYNSSWDLFDHHLYPGGAWRLHMLRHLVGEDAFWAGTRDYLETYSQKTAETADFRKVMEKHSGLNLVAFFDQWLYGKGYPKLKATYKYDGEKTEATLVVEQSQADKDKGVGLFKLPLEVEYTDDAGAHRVTLQIEAARTTATIKLEGKCKQVCFDPGCKALFSLEFNPGNDLLGHALKHADVRNRIRAAEELIKTGTRKNLETVRDAFLAEPFWGVRAAVGRALGKSGHAAAIPVLAELLGSEQEPRAKRGLAEGCGKMRDDRLRRALHAFLQADQPPFARGGALTSLGAQRIADDMEQLAAEANAPEVHRLVVDGALRGIGALGTSEALDFLEPRIAYGGESENSRPAAVRAYGTCARLVERRLRVRARERLEDLTRDPVERIRNASGAALAALGDRAAMPAIESLKRLQPAQDEPRIERWAAKLRKGAPGEEARKLKEQVEKLEERCRKLDERIQDIEAKET